MLTSSCVRDGFFQAFLLVFEGFEGMAARAWAAAECLLECCRPNL